MNVKNTIRPRVRDAIIQSLKAGVVPRVGQHHIQVGRIKEVEALLGDIERIADGGSAIRFIIGAYGSGKTFFLNLIRSIAMEKRLVTAHADLNIDRRIHATGGQARSLYQELMRNLSTRAKPDGGAISSVVEKFVTTALNEAKNKNRNPEEVIRNRLIQITEMVGGYDFANIIASYWRGYDTGNEELKTNALRWLRAEFSTKTDARVSLNVRTIINDANFYDHLKLFARFLTLAGYSGLIVCLDELVNLYKLSSRQARSSNYEQILRMLNDSLQGSAYNLGFLLGGTPEFLLDTRKGLYSYSALHTRLAENIFATNGLVDYSGPVIKLTNLSPEDLFVLLCKVRNVYYSGNSNAHQIPDEAIYSFMEHCSKRIGNAYFQTPRNSITAFVNILSVLEQNPEVKWKDLIGKVQIPQDLDSEGDDELSTFKL